MQVDPKQVKGRAQVQVDFGFTPGVEETITSATVAAPWVRADSVIACSVSLQTTADHSGEDAAIEGLQAYPGNLVPGTSFDVTVYAPEGTWGRYLVNTQGC